MTESASVEKVETQPRATAGLVWEKRQQLEEAKPTHRYTYTYTYTCTYTYTYTYTGTHIQTYEIIYILLYKDIV